LLQVMAEVEVNLNHIQVLDWEALKDPARLEAGVQGLKIEALQRVFANPKVLAWVRARRRLKPPPAQVQGPATQRPRRPHLLPVMYFVICKTEELRHHSQRLRAGIAGQRRIDVGRRLRHLHNHLLYIQKTLKGLKFLALP
jgi:hypothetical protein